MLHWKILLSINIHKSRNHTTSAKSICLTPFICLSFDNGWKTQAMSRIYLIEMNRKAVDVVPFLPDWTNFTQS